MKKSIINCQNLCFSYRTYKKSVGISGAIHDFLFRKYEETSALCDINLEIDEGDIVALVGPNGAGKTTLIKILTGILPSTSGYVSTLGYDPFKKEKKYLSKIGVIFGQKNQLLWDLPAIDSFKELSVIYGNNVNDYDSNIYHLSEMLNIKDYLNIPVRKLSLGQKVKFNIIASLFYNPSLLFLDEPTIGLDILSQNEIHKFLREINSKYNTTIILTSHYPKDISELANRIVVIKNGSILDDTNIPSFMKKYGNDECYIITTNNNLPPIFTKSETYCEKISDNEYRVYVDGHNIQVLC